MTKKFWVILALIFSFVLTNSDLISDNSVEAKNLQAKVHSKRIVAGTRFKLQSLTRIDTCADGLGSDFNAALTEDIMVDDTVMLPQGTVIRGSIVQYNKPRRFSRGAVVYIGFDHVVTTEGKQLPIKAAFGEIENLYWDGGIIAGGNFGYAVKQTSHRSGQIIKKSTNWGIEVGDDGFKGLKYVTTPLAAVGGTIGAGFYWVGDVVADMFREGKEVVIPEDTLFTIILVKDLDVPVNY